MSASPETERLGPNGRPIRPFVMPQTWIGKFGVWRYIILRRVVQVGVLLLFIGDGTLGLVAGRAAAAGGQSEQFRVAGRDSHGRSLCGDPDAC